MSSEKAQKPLESFSNRRTPAAWAFGRFRLEPREGLLLCDGKAVTLTLKAFEVLQFLLERHGHLVTRDDLVAHVWPDAFVDEANLTSTIWMIRKSLGQDGEWIQTVPKRGYRFVGAVQEIPRDHSEGEHNTLAVLPFRALAADRRVELFELGLPDVLIARLSRLDAVRILPLVATERVGHLEPIEAGRALGADVVLTGGLQRAEGHWRVSVRLLAVHDGRALWSAAFDVEDQRIFAAQDAIIERVIDELAPVLSPDERRRLNTSGTASRDAFEAYLKGRAFTSRPDPFNLARALESFRTAVTLDPAFGDAWASLAIALRVMTLTADARPHDVFPEAKRAALRALAIRPDHAEAHVALGGVAFWFDWNWAEAERLLRRGIELQPSSPSSHFDLGHLLSNLGRGDEAVLQARRARELDPGWRLTDTLEGQYLFMARRYEEALVPLEAALEVEPNVWWAHTMRADPLIELGRFREAIAACERASELSRGHLLTRTVLGYALARVGSRPEAEAIACQLQTLSRERYVPPHHRALIAHALGDTTASLAILEEALTERDVYVTFLGADPKWDGLRGDARFESVLERANLAEVSRRVTTTARDQ